MFGVWIPIKAPRVAKTNLARPLSDKKKKGIRSAKRNLERPLSGRN